MEEERRLGRDRIFLTFLFFFFFFFIGMYTREYVFLKNKDSFRFDYMRVG